jgi:hypothetical protein
MTPHRTGIMAYITMVFVSVTLNRGVASTVTARVCCFNLITPDSFCRPNGSDLKVKTLRIN